MNQSQINEYLERAFKEPLEIAAFKYAIRGMELMAQREERSITEIFLSFCQSASPSIRILEQLEKRYKKDRVGVMKCLEMAFEKGVSPEKEDQGLIHSMIAQGAVELLKRVSERFPSIDWTYRCEEAWSHLHRASYRENIQIVDFLLEKPEVRAIIDEKNNAGISALHSALQYRNHEMAKKILESGADPHQKTRDGESLLHMSAFYNDRSFFDMIIQRDVDLFELTDHQSSVLHDAMWSENVEMIRHVMELGGHRWDLNHQDATGKTIFDVAMVCDDQKTLEYLEGFRVALEEKESLSEVVFGNSKPLEGEDGQVKKEQTGSHFPSKGESSKKGLRI